MSRTDIRVVEFPADVIPIQYHFNMLNDARRMGGFQRAAELAVKPGMRVLDLGCGTGVLSWFAARQGAERVYAVERLPELAAVARTTLDNNPDGDRVTVTNADVNEYLPPEPVDVVFCEMLHTGLLREKQVSVIRDFKERYLARFGGPLPAFVPEATLQAVQPIQQDFEYFGYRAATPMFQDANPVEPRSTELGGPALFQSFVYDGELPTRCEMDSPVEIHTGGVFNAVRMITKNLLAISLGTGETAEWLMGYLVIPLPAPVAVKTGDRPVISFGYQPGDELSALTASITVTNERASIEAAQLDAARS